MDLQHKQYRELRKGLQVWLGEKIRGQLTGDIHDLAITEGVEQHWGAGPPFLRQGRL